MSNHSGSYMLNDVLHLLHNKYNFFSRLNDQEIEKFISEILAIGSAEDCNAGEILENIGTQLKFCYYCRQKVDQITEDDRCNKCNNE